MNFHAKQPQLTPAETALIDGFVDRASELPGDGAILVLRDNAVERLKGGLPNRKIEAWHYTDLRRLLSSVPAFDPTAKPRTVAPLVDGSAIAAVLNGSAGRLPGVEGATITSFRDGLTDGSHAELLGAIDGDDAIGLINSAFVTDGYVVDVAEGAELATPIELQNLQDGGQTHVRHVVRAGAGSKSVFVERQTGTRGALVSSVSHLDVADGADVLWVIVQEQPDDACHLGQIRISLGKDAKLSLFVLNAGAKLVRQEIRAVAASEGSDFRLRGVNLLGGATHCDVTMVLDHAAPDTTSTEVVRNVVTGKAHGVFQGQIRVTREAQKTDAKMSCNTLLLSDEGEFSTKPELEIFADDVACGHGATVTEIDASHLFYLMARGVTEKEARGLLVKAFVAEIIEELEDEALVAALEEKLDAWFAEHG